MLLMRNHRLDGTGGVIMLIQFRDSGGRISLCRCACLVRVRTGYEKQQGS